MQSTQTEWSPFPIVLCICLLMILTKPNITQPRTLKADLNEFKGGMGWMLIIIHSSIRHRFAYVPFLEELRFKLDIFA